MIDFVKESEEDLKKFMEHFPENGDVVLQILKGHLLLEELVREIFEIQLPLPTALTGSKGASFTCHQVICLVEAMTPHSQTIPWVWVAAKKLNSLRNNLAHNLAPEGIEEKINEFIYYVKSESPEIEVEVSKIDKDIENDLVVVIIAMCACLSSLKPVLKAHAKHA